MAELESLMIAELEAEPDSIFRGAAWIQAENASRVNFAEQNLRRIDRMIEGARSESIAQSVRSDRLARAYRDELGEVVKLVDPRTPKRCASARWRIIHAAALRAQAL